MYLSKLELHGFKSFATPTVLRFDPGITAIVGPNGCGKSNVVDAVRWVIGEQRARILRSDKMENVIFNGAARRRPLGMSEVLLTVENTRGVLPTEYSEVTIGRRLYRSGESEYLLNGTPCRLRDIVDLFMDTGMGAGAYSVIELKMIDEILSDNAHDRRHLFEEAAGITKYKQRRSQTLRRLDGTQADLTRLRDLTEEIEKRVRTLKRQAAKAARHKEHKGRLHRLELALAQAEYDRLTRQEDTLRAEMEGLQDALEQHTAHLATHEAELAALRKTQIDREQALSEHQQQLNAHLAAVRDVEADLRLEQERLDGARRDRDRTAREQEEDGEQRRALEHNADRLAAELTEAEPFREEAQRVLQEAQANRDTARSASETRREALHDLRRQEQRLTEEYVEHLRRLDRLNNRLELLKDEQERSLDQAGNLQNQSREHEDLLQESAKQVAAAEKAADAARAALEEATREHDARRQRLETATDALRQVERQHDAVAAEAHLLESLVASFDAFPDAVQFLAADPSWTPTVLQTVADLLVCDAAHQAALDAALGDLSTCLVVQTDQEARHAMDRLQAEQKGRATFLVLDRLLPSALTDPATFHANGAARPLRFVVRVNDPAHEQMAALLLHGCYLVASLEEGREQAAQSPGPARYVTPTGEWIDARGLVHGGGEQTGAVAGTQRRNHREHLDATQEHLLNLLEELEHGRAEVEALRAEVEALPIASLRGTLAEAEQAYAEADREHERLTYAQEARARRQADLSAHQESLVAEDAARQAELPPLQTALADAEAGLTALRAAREAAEDAFQTAEAARRAAEDRFGEANVAAVETRNRRDNLRRDLDRTRQEIGALERRSQERHAHLETIQHLIDAAQERHSLLQQQLDAVRANRAGLEASVTDAREALLQSRTDIDQVEARLRALRQVREETIREENTRAVRRAEIHTRKDDLLASVKEDFGVSLGVDPIEMDDDFDEAAARSVVQDLRRKIKDLGSVNALALDEYEQEKERFEFMNAQKEDLEHAEATLLQTIDEINTTAVARFDATYEAIRASFRSLFAELFGQDAAADLLLVDPNDPLESAIDIVAKPRGKRPINISQLSSGEKTLTAIALLFAIYLVKPSPFCFLDEVDAPLDDANIDRFMRLIRRFADHTQFILVTHNKRTMELADRLYGITMQEQGVSRLVGVKFEEAMAMAE